MELRFTVKSKSSNVYKFNGSLTRKQIYPLPKRMIKKLNVFALTLGEK